MKSKFRLKQYVDHVVHPRYGKWPGRRTSSPTKRRRPAISPDSRECARSPGTAVEADLQRQIPSTVPVLYYYDVDTACRDCGRRFLFFAEEQKYWYEELKFYIFAEPARCPVCRKRLQYLRRMHRRYEELFHVPERSLEETLEMADCCLTLIEEGIFSSRQTERVRMLLNLATEEQRSSGVGSRPDRPIAHGGIAIGRHPGKRRLVRVALTCSVRGAVYHSPNGEKPLHLSWTRSNAP